MARRSDHTREEIHRLILDAARAIVEESGLRGLTTRRIADLIGYTPGTLYLLFKDLNDIIVHMNAETLDRLYESCSQVDLSAPPSKALEKLAARYVRFVSGQPKLWNAVLEHRLPEGQVLPRWYHERTNRLLGLVDATLRPKASRRPGRSLHDARVLWASLYGITSLAGSDNLGGDTPKALVRSLTLNYAAGLRFRRHAK